MIGLGAISLLGFAMLACLLSVCFDIAPAEVSLPVMQLSRPAVCLGGLFVRIDGPVTRLDRLSSCPLHVSVGSLLELGGAAHLLGRRTVHRLHAVADRMVVLMQLRRPCLSLFSSVGSVTGVTGLAGTLEAAFASLVLVASARWSSHTGQHRSTSGRDATGGATGSGGDLEMNVALAASRSLSSLSPGPTWAKYLAPTLNTCQLVDITPGTVRPWPAHLIVEGVSPTVVAKAYRLLRAVLNTAVEDELIRRNPCRIKGAGQEQPAERPVATVAQV